MHVGAPLQPPLAMRHLPRVLGLALFAALLGAPFLALSNSGGAPAGRAGDPPGRVTCATSGCHGAGNLNNGPGRVAIEVPATYEPGEAFTFAIEVTQSGISRWGFQVAVRDAADQHVGTLQLLDQAVTRRADALGNYVTHTRSGINQNRWEIGWEAPQENAGPVTFYVSGMAANANGSSSGDDVYSISATVEPGMATNVETVDVPAVFDLVEAYPNPATEVATLRYTLLQAEPVVVTLRNLLGQEMWSRSLGLQPVGAHEARIPVASLAGGLYHLELRTSAARQVRSLTVVR